MIFEIKNLAELPEVAEKILNFAENSPKVWLFQGEMGAGKTTLIKALGKALGVTDTIQSPTYSLVNEYISPTVGKIYHFDLYRLKHETEAYDFGIEEYLDSGRYCWIEWAERIPNLLPADCLTVKITVEDEKRVIDLFSY
ncbi:MAG: tRNA (adenosine(37)-N6)-threonylcarbamoyltransferase complex ATPase subunit type 1 TsaE [Bacteroidetes bacterium]|nr:MAG: tRNA (adenosine(37)-N6)-threonylcarbamoyltransferase complex ATPase subunit type 1 TsaE [Bacteroidota bacterium]